MLDVGLFGPTCILENGGERSVFRSTSAWKIELLVFCGFFGNGTHDAKLLRLPCGMPLHIFQTCTTRYHHLHVQCCFLRSTWHPCLLSPTSLSCADIWIW